MGGSTRAIARRDELRNPIVRSVRPTIAVFVMACARGVSMPIGSTEAGVRSVMPSGDLKHRAKPWNERVKLVATFFNTAGLATVAAAFINPIANRHYDVLADGGWILLLAAGGAHILGQVALAFFAAED